MKTNCKTVILVSVFILALVAVASFVFVYKDIQKEKNIHKYISQSVARPEDLFADFKSEKEKLVGYYENISQKSDDYKVIINGSRTFCWNDSSKTYERISIDQYDQKILDFSDKFSKTVAADLNGNKINEEYKLQNGKLIAMENLEIIWQSDDNWWVDDFSLADSNNDGAVELNLSVWKSGNFGQFKPFWIKENDPSVKNHFFVFAFKNGKIRPVWQSSNLPAPNCEFTFSDLDNDGKNELIVLEGDYADSPDCKGKYTAVWKWDEWGFVNEWRSEKEEFVGVEVEDSGAKKCMIMF